MLFCCNAISAFLAHRVESLRCEGSEQSGHAESVEERVDLTKMTHNGSRAHEFVVMHNSIA